jgi:hypothetical protein
VSDWAGYTRSVKSRCLNWTKGSPNVQSGQYELHLKERVTLVLKAKDGVEHITLSHMASPSPAPYSQAGALSFTQATPSPPVLTSAPLHWPSCLPQWALLTFLRTLAKPTTALEVKDISHLHPLGATCFRWRTAANKWTIPRHNLKSSS